MRRARRRFAALRAIAGLTAFLPCACTLPPEPGDNLLRVLSVALLLLVGLAVQAFAQILGPAQAIDGDTLAIGGLTLRLYGVDAPEAEQTCKTAAGADWACGAAARARLSELVATGNLRCEAIERDRYGRVVGRCAAAGRDIGGALVSEGLAWAYRRFSRATSRPRPAPPAAESGRARPRRPGSGGAEATGPPPPRRRPRIARSRATSTSGANASIIPRRRPGTTASRSTRRRASAGSATPRRPKLPGGARRPSLQGVNPFTARWRAHLLASPRWRSHLICALVTRRPARRRVTQPRANIWFCDKPRRRPPADVRPAR